MLTLVLDRIQAGEHGLVEALGRWVEFSADPGWNGGLDDGLSR